MRWTPNLPARGYYTVYAWWPVTGSVYATNAPYHVVHAGGPAGGEVRLMSQQIKGGKWNYLGTYLLAAGEEGYVELHSDADGRLHADAVRFAPAGN